MLVVSEDAVREGRARGLLVSTSVLGSAQRGRLPLGPASALS